MFITLAWLMLNTLVLLYELSTCCSSLQFVLTLVPSLILPSVAFAVQRALVFPSLSFLTQ